jgi:CRISPR/Cas system Type II protein with McrA/HNH and RuvC-like nuclease domain
MSDLDYLVRNLRLEYEWLQFVSLTNEVLDVETVSWSAYHSSKERGPHVNISISSLMPILQEQAHSVATIKHAMDKVKEVTSFLNPRQTPVMACDQPLFVLAKQIQWEWPEI